MGEDSAHHRRVQRGLAVEMMEERGLSETDQFGNLAQADPGEPPFGKELLRSIENLVARSELDDFGSWHC